MSKMSALTQEMFADPRLFSPERWVDFTSKEMVLLDPANGNPYKPGQPPEWIAADDRLANGYDLLGRVGMNHDLTIAYGKHMVDRDLNRSLWQPRWYEKEAAGSTALAWERAGWVRQGQGGVIASKDYLESGRAIEDLPRSMRGFARRVVRTALDLDRSLFSYDVELTDRPLDVAILSVGSLWDKQESVGFSKKLDLLFRATQHLRDWYIPGKYMHEAHQLAEDIGESPKVLMTLGSAHQAVSTIMGDSGLVSNDVFLPRSVNRRNAMLRELHTTGRIRRDVAENELGLTLDDLYR